ncbi:MAG: TRAP transporter small permease [Clostridiales bacterium]|nr:TRAP transporter small permease [Clostridiales bacterium]
MGEDKDMAVAVAADEEAVVDEDEINPRFEYYPGVFLTPRVKEVPIYENVAARVASWSSWISMGAIIFLLGMTFLDVILRALFSAPFPGTYDWTRYLMVLIASFGMPLCTMNDEHVCIDFLVRRLPDRIQTGLAWFGYALAVLVLSIYVSQSWEQGTFNASIGQTSVGVPWPTYPFFYFISIGFACMLGIVVVKMINLGRGVK